MALARKPHALTLVPRRLPTLTLADRQDEPRLELDELTKLHRMMSARITLLEAHLHELPPGRLETFVCTYVRSARTLRELLVRASSLPNIVPTAPPSFDELLTKATLHAYRWAVDQLAQVRHLFGAREANGVSSVPLGALSAFHELSELCASSGRVEAAHLVTLQAIDGALYRLIETRDCIEQLTAPREGTVRTSWRRGPAARR